MIKIISVVFIALALVSCTPSYNDNTGKYKLPPELSDCKIFDLSGGDAGMTTLYVVRCPDSHTTTASSCGKSCTRSVTSN